ncbi:hypothetical protein [Nocardia iowensis]
MIDRSESVVVFALGPNPDDGFTRTVRTQDDFAVQQAWRELVADHDLRPEQVTELFTEWQPSTADALFIEQTFGEIELSHMFERPAPDGWDIAFAEASAALEAEIRRREAEAEATTRRIDESTKDGVVLPVLRSTSLPGSDIVQDAMQYLPLGDHIYVTLARMAKTPHGTIGMTPLLNHDFTDDDDVSEQFSTAIMALAGGLTLEGWATADGPIARVARQDSFQGGSAILLPGFHEWVADNTGWQDLIVAIHCPDELFVTPADSAMAEKMRRDVHNAQPRCAELRPALFRITGNGLDNIEFVLESNLT